MKVVVQKSVAEDSCIVLLPVRDPGLAPLVQAAIGQELTMEEDPHVTVLYLGKGFDQTMVDEVAAVVGAELKDFGPAMLTDPTLIAFHHGMDGTPIVLEYATAPEIRALHDHLLPLLAHLITAKQFPTYRPHVTIGYAPEILSDQARRALGLISVSGPDLRIPVKTVDVRFGGKAYKSFPVIQAPDVVLLRAMHDAVHAAYRSNYDETARRAMMDRHADIVDTLLSAGVEHPTPPSDGLDETLEMIGETSSVLIRKSDSAKRLVYGVVLEPDVVDSQNEWEQAEVIEKTAQEFLARYNTETQLGLQHVLFGDLGIDLAESYIAPQDLDFDGELGPDDLIRKGSWVMCVKVHNEDIWQGVLDGSITGFSVRGIATILAKSKGQQSL